jgi:hypothetical protein
MVDEAEARARRHVRRAKVEMWAWTVLLVPLTAVIVVLPDRVGVAIVTALSIYALVLTAKGNVRAGDAEVAGRENP